MKNVRGQRRKVEQIGDLCNAAAEFLHNSPADNYLHINNDEACQRYYSDFLQNNDYGQRNFLFIRIQVLLHPMNGY